MRYNTKPWATTGSIHILFITYTAGNDSIEHIALVDVTLQTKQHSSRPCHCDEHTPQSHMPVTGCTREVSGASLHVYVHVLVDT